MITARRERPTRVVMRLLSSRGESQTSRPREYTRRHGDPDRERPQGTREAVPALRVQPEKTAGRAALSGVRPVGLAVVEAGRFAGPVQSGVAPPTCDRVLGRRGCARVRADIVDGAVVLR